MQKITPFLWFDDNAHVRSQRVMKAMLQMKKLDVEGLKKAYAQRDSDTGGDWAKSA